MASTVPVKQSLPVVWRVIRYALPYKYKAFLVLVSMLLFALLTFGTYLLIEPLLDNHLIRGTDKTSSLDIVAHLQDGTELRLNKILREVHPWYIEWLEKHPYLYSILVSEARIAPPVQIEENSVVIPPAALKVHRGGSSWIKQGEWVPFIEEHPEFATRLLHFTQSPRTELSAPIWIYGLIIPILYFIKGIFAIVRQYLLAWVALSVVRDIQNDLYHRLLKQPMSFFHQARTGDLMSRMVNDVMVLSSQIVQVLTDLIQEPLLVITAVAACFWRDWQLALAFFFMVPAVAIPMQIMSRKIRKASRRAQEKRADISSVLVETLTGIEVVKAFNMENYEQERYSEETKTLMRRELRIRKTRALSSPATEMAASIGVALVIGIAMWRMAQEPDFQIGKLAFFTICFTQMVKPLDKFAKARFQLGEMAEAGKRVFAIMDREPEIVESPTAVDVPDNWSSISFNKVSFSYGRDTVLHDIDLHVRRGEKIAIVGRTGSGKTTLVHLLARFYDPASGSIRIDDIDLRQLRTASLLSHIGLVTQRVILFNDTVANNIAYGRPDISRGEIIAAAEAAFADEFIRELPQGYDTIIGEMGALLSGGQAQRLSIARAILKNPDILILDEATASLDTASERKVQAALDNLMANRTTFAIAHRLSTIRNADRIVVLSAGRIVESGSHDELAAKGGIYAKLYEAQFKGYSNDIEDV